MRGEGGFLFPWFLLLSPAYSLFSGATSAGCPAPSSIINGQGWLPNLTILRILGKSLEAPRLNCWISVGSSPRVVSAPRTGGHKRRVIGNKEMSCISTRGQDELYWMRNLRKEKEKRRLLEMLRQRAVSSGFHSHSASGSLPLFSFPLPLFII